LAKEREFRVELLRPSRDVAIVVADGEIDIFTAPRLKEALEGALESKARHLIVDIVSVPFIDSTGLSVLVAAFKRSNEHGARLAIVGSQAAVRRVFEITRLEDVFTFYVSREQALAATAPSPTE
jgi:anti-sigma B factor antagonist